MSIDFAKKGDSSKLSVIQSSTILSKIEAKLPKLPKSEQSFFLKSQIDQLQSKFGNNYPLLFPLTEKYINIQKQKAEEFFESNEYEESLKIYKTCLRLTEPLPGSDWTKLPSWSKIRIHLMNNIAILYQKLNKIEQAIEYTRLGINLEDTYGHQGEYDARYNNIFFSAGNQLMILEQYEEALKYLLKVENKIYDQYQVGKIIQRKKIDKKIDKNFLMDNPTQYLQLLNLICKAYIKIGNYSRSDVYYERQSELTAILQKDKIIGGKGFNLFEGFNFNVNERSDKKSQTLKQEKTEKKADKAEEFEPTVNQTTIDRSTIKKLTEKLDALGNKVNLTEGNDKIKNVNKPKDDIKKEKKRNITPSKNLKQTMKETNNNYPPLNFKFRKPLFHKVKKLPLLELSSLPKSSSLSKLLPQKNKIISINKKRVKSQTKPVVFPKIPQMEEKNLISKEIDKKIKDIQITLNKQSTLKTISSLSKKSLSRSGTFKSFQEEEEKKQPKKSLSKQNSINKNMLLPPIDKVHRKTVKKKVVFESEKTKKNIEILSDEEKDDSDNEYANLKPAQNSKNKQPYVANRKISENLSEKRQKGKKKTSKYSENINMDVENNKLLNEQKLIKEKINKINADTFNPVKIDVPSNKKETGYNNNNNIQENDYKKLNEKIVQGQKGNVNPKMKNLAKSFYNLVLSYYNQTQLITDPKFNKSNKKSKVFSIKDICLIKTINNKIYKIFVSLPFLTIPSNLNKRKNDKTAIYPYLSVDIYYGNFDKIFQSKYNIKINITEELVTFSEELQNEIIENISSINKNLNLSWSICLFFFENWFSIFKSAYEYNLNAEIDEVKRIFYKKYVQNLNEYIANISKWESKNILMTRENKYINLLLKYFYILLKYTSIQTNIIGNNITIKNLDEIMIRNKYKQLLEDKKTVLNNKNILNKAGNKILLKSKTYYINKLIRTFIR